MTKFNYENYEKERKKEWEKDIANCQQMLFFRQAASNAACTGIDKDDIIARSKCHTLSNYTIDQAHLCETLKRNFDLTYRK